jgi:DNA-binding NarL/FixJ family response regulator
MYSSTDTVQDRRDAADVGAAGFLVKDADFGALVAAIRTVADGGVVWPEAGLEA